MRNFSQSLLNIDPADGWGPTLITDSKLFTILSGAMALGCALVSIQLRLEILLIDCFFFFLFFCVCVYGLSTNFDLFKDETFPKNELFFLQLFCIELKVILFSEWLGEYRNNFRHELKMIMIPNKY